MTKTASLTFHGYWTIDTLPHLLPVSAVFCIYQSEVDLHARNRKPGKLLYIGASRKVRDSVTAWIRLQFEAGSILDPDLLLVTVASVPPEELDNTYRALITEHCPPFNKSILPPSCAMVVFAAGTIHSLQASFYLPHQKSPLQLVKSDLHNPTPSTRTIVG